MADNDISSCVVRGDGWSVDVTIDGAGYAVGATYNFGSLGDTPATISAPTFVVTVVSKGYSSSGVLGTITRTLYGTHVVPKFDTTPDETDTGTGLVVRVALNESIYVKDNTGAGNSGTVPTVSIAAGWCTSGANVSNAVTDLAVTNNSTLAYPKVTAQWAWGHTPAWRGVEADFSIGCIAVHGQGIACVALSATDAHSNSVTGTVTTKTKHLMSASGLYYESYDLAVPISGFTSGDDVTLKYVAYPLVGDADSIIDTSIDTTSTDDCLGLTQITTRLVSSVASLYVAATDHPTTPGNDTTGDGSTATPYATIGKALDVLTDGAGKVNRIYAKAGGTTLGILGSTPASVAATGCFIEVLPNPGDTVTLNRGATYIAYKATKLLYSGVTITGNNWLDGGNVAGAKLWFQDCTIDPTALNGTAGLGYRTEFTNFVNCTFSTRDNITSGAVRTAYAHTGCLHSQGGLFGAQATIVATKAIAIATADTTRVSDLSASGLAPITHNILYANSAFLNCTQNTSATVSINNNGAKSQVAVIGNIIEVIAGTQPALWFGGDNNTYQLDDVVMAHNTVTGQRCNIWYNDQGVVAVYRNNCFSAYNAFSSYNIKGWLFGTPDANRIGNAASMNGVNIHDNRYDGTASSTFTGDYDGINVSYVLAKDATFGQLGYTSDKSQYGDAGGQGNYYPTTDSALYNAAPAASLRYQSYDLYGNAV